jgi:hypothetical protein
VGRRMQQRWTLARRSACPGDRFQRLVADGFGAYRSEGLHGGPLGSHSISLDPLLTSRHRSRRCLGGNSRGNSGMGNCPTPAEGRTSNAAYHQHALGRTFLIREMALLPPRPPYPSPYNAELPATWPYTACASLVRIINSTNSNWQITKRSSWLSKAASLVNIEPAISVQILLRTTDLAAPLQVLAIRKMQSIWGTAVPSEVAACRPLRWLSQS